ncbi:urotensin 2 domain containing precursor, partial [Triplophysa rosa]
DVVPSGSFLPRFLAFILLISALDIQTGSLASPVNQIYRSMDDSNIQNQIVAFLLRKNVLPAREEEAIGLELASKIAELQKLGVLQDELNLERQLVSNAIEKERTIPKKRNDACFWKYCI